MAVTHDGGLSGGSLAVDEETDLALLNQHLVKTNTLSQRMTTILSQLDSRLSRLDKSIAPLGIRELTRQAANLDAVLEQVAPGASRQQARPPVDRGASFNTIASGAGGGFNDAASSNSGHGGLSASVGAGGGRMSMSQSFGRLDKPAESSPPPATPMSVMDRTRAVPRTDVLPRWQEGPSNPASPAAAPHDDPLATGQERAIIEKGPDIMSLKEYFGALKVVIGDLEQMYQGMVEGRGGTREQGVAELSALVEDGFNRLVELLLTRTKETMPQPFDPTHLINSAPQPVTTYYQGLSSVKALSTGLVAIVEPTTPTPRTTEILTPILGRCLNGLGAIRGEWLRRSLGGLARQVEDAPNTWDAGDGDKVRLTLKLWEAFVVASEAEVEVAGIMLPGAAGERLVDVTVPHGVAVLSSTMSAIIASIKRNLSENTMLLLNLYQSLTDFGPRYDATMSHVLSEDNPEVRTALTGPLGTLRSLALRSFPERLADIRTPARNAGTTTAIDDTTHATLVYLEQLPSFGQLAETLLRSTGHGERAWLMGMKEPPSTARSAAEEGGIVNLYAADVLGTLLSYLEQRAKSMRRPIGAGFLLNNLSHIRNTTSSFNADIIGPGAEDMLNKHFREAKTQYLTEFQALVQLLSHTAQTRFNVGSSDKQSTKEAAASFFDRVAELETTCKQYPFSRQDPELRERIGAEVGELVRAGYAAFWTKAHSRGYDKYLRQSPDDLHRRILGMFR